MAESFQKILTHPVSRSHVRTRENAGGARRAFDGRRLVRCVRKGRKRASGVGSQRAEKFCEGDDLNPRAGVETVVIPQPLRVELADTHFAGLPSSKHEESGSPSVAADRSGSPLGL